MIFSKKTNRTWKAETFKESLEIVNNPGMGWYHLFPFDLSVPPDFEELDWCLKEEESLVLVLIDIGAYRNLSIPIVSLDRLREILSYFKDAGKHMILRIAYDREGKGAEVEPELFSTVEGHMRTLGEVIAPFLPSILVVQGLLIGRWGEMHGSKFLSEKRLRALYQIWREVLGPDMPIAVRTPAQWRMLTGTEIVDERLGVFNDGMFGSEDDLGTYGKETEEEPSFVERWPREQELFFLEEITGRVPYGGEAVGEAAEGSLERAVCELRRLHAVYLNREHDQNRLKQWEKSRWKLRDHWKGVRGLTYIGAHLGYRLVVQKVTVKTNKKLPLIVSVEIANRGFAAVGQQLVFCLELSSNRSRNLQAGVADLRSGQETCVEVPLEPEWLEADQPVRVFARLTLEDGTTVRFANAGAGETLLLGEFF